MKLKYKEHKPIGFIGHFVHCFWLYENAGGQLYYTILPHGYFEVIAEFTDGILNRIYQTGIWTQPTKVIIPKNTLILAIRFKLTAAEYLFQHPISTIKDRVTSLPVEFWNFNQYRKTGFNRFIKGISDDLQKQLTNFPLQAIDERKLKLFKLIYQNKFQSVEQLSEHIGWSSRQINRYFNQTYGLPLKEFLKIIRCSSAYKYISQGDLSAPVNYFDQSHFIKDIKHYTGKTPRELYQDKDERFLQLLTQEPR